MKVEDVFKRHFESEGVSFCDFEEIWGEICQEMNVPAGLLRIDDRLNIELAPERGWEFDGELAAINLAAQRRIQKQGITVDLRQIQTVRDYIMCFARRSADTSVNRRNP